MVERINLESEQFLELTEAIARGKYSWACILLLQLVGYNPIDYLPYRTYYRFVKERLQTHSNKNNALEESQSRDRSD